MPVFLKHVDRLFGSSFGFVGNLLGFGLGPILNHYLQMPNGPQVVMSSLGITGAVFIGLSAFIAIAIFGLAVITVVSRSFFMIPERELPLPDWLKRGLKYAPLAALTAVIAPEILMTQGELIGTFMDARIPAVLCATAYYFWRRGILGTIVVGMVVYLPLHIGWNW